MDLLLRPLVWVVAAVSAAALIGHWSWTLSARSPSNSVEAWLARILSSPRNAAIARACLMVLPLALAAWLRIIEPPALGLSLPTSPRGVVLAAALAIAAGGWTVIAQGAFERAAGREASRSRTRPSWFALEAVALGALGFEAYWAFVRGAFLSVGLANGTLAVFLSLSVLALQAWASPGRRAQMLDPASASVLARHALTALSSALVFLAAGSLLVCFGAHLAMSVAYLVAGLESASDPLAREVDAVGVEPTIV